ncbi:DegT/DnrJ/EryC1/StrS family aminotransferase [Patescibacteria group bacterium]|nr:DegT/DnrJ/EryC1/StrS family aminotransferase [Patescibacteria group bacterium]
MIIREVEKPRLRDLIGLSKYQSDKIIQDFLGNIKIIGSGKGAIAIIFKYLLEKGVIVNKLDEVLVADWVGYWVYNQIQQFTFPTKRFSNRCRAILVYHQYGFPQDMDKILEFAHDKNLIIIEDCAHSLKSYYKGKLLGTFGDFSIYSFSKWFFCFALGGVSSRFADFNSFASHLIKDAPFGVTLYKDIFKYIYECSSFSKSVFFRKHAELLLNTSYALYGEAFKTSWPARSLLNSKIAREINIRQERYQYFLRETADFEICGHLEREGITPYIIPIYCPEAKNSILLKALAERNIQSGLYHFDFGRNLLSPNFKKCILIPCHAGISDKVFSDITDLVVRIIKS